MTNIYPIDSNSIVFDIGAYEGQWAKDILTRYQPKEMYLFEPQKWAYDACIKKFINNHNVKIYNFALGTTRREKNS
jgi:FkbM family methyltransferase